MRGLGLAVESLSLESEEDSNFLCVCMTWRKDRSTGSCPVTVLEPLSVNTCLPRWRM
jgi:hypothetical protein